jgi:hypothetical protein
MLKKKWIRPQLIVVVRGKPEENVLSKCYSAPFSGGDVGCWYDSGGNWWGLANVRGGTS